MLLATGLGLAGLLGLVLLFSGLATWVLSQGHAPPVRGALRATPTAIAVASADPPAIVLPAPTPLDLANIHIVPPPAPTPAPVLARSISYARPANSAPPPVATDPPTVAPWPTAPPWVDPTLTHDQAVEADAFSPPLPEIPVYDDPNIISGGSIAGQTPVNEPTPPPLAQGGGGEGTPQHPSYDDPQINSGGSIGGDGK